MQFSVREMELGQSMDQNAFSGMPCAGKTSQDQLEDN
jgi:hypothetical protein